MSMACSVLLLIGTMRSHISEQDTGWPGSSDPFGSLQNSEWAPLGHHVRVNVNVYLVI